MRQEDFSIIELEDTVFILPFSLLPVRELQRLREVCKRFESLASACLYHKIESDSNYRPGCTPKQLMDLVMKDGSTPYSPRKHAMMIQKSEEECNLGRLYAIRMTAYGDPFGQAFLYAPTICVNIWFVDTIMLLVKSNCNISIHTQEDKNLATPLTNLSLEDYLGCECLHDPEVREASGAARS